MIQDNTNSLILQSQNPEKIDNEILRDTVLEIDLKALADNVTKIRSVVGQDIALTAVVKANAYGLGAVQVAKTLIEAGATYLAVATLSEAIEIKNIYPEYPVFIMGHTPDKYLSHVVEYDITATIFSLHQAEILNELAGKAGKKAKVHIKLDTGFHRLGMDATDERIVKEILAVAALPNIDAEGIFSHLALVNDEENEKQYALFAKICDELKSVGLGFRYYHLADSIASVDNPEFRLNMVRVGALLYGMRGFHKGFVAVEQVMTFKAAISQLHHIKAGEGVSYDYLWRASRDSVIATLPFGYADGYPRNMRDKGFVTIRGIKCPLVGVLCMDQVMADVTDVPYVREGDWAVIYGSGENEMTIQEASTLAGTNKNDILARISARPARVYKR